MLVLTRKQGEKLVIGDQVTVSVLSVRGNRVRIGIEAPGQVRVIRAELAGWSEEFPAADHDLAPGNALQPLGSY